MNRYRIEICDDEKGTCAWIEEFVYRFLALNSVKGNVDVWYSGEDCIRSMEAEDIPDILFLDIEFPGMSGLDVGKYVRSHLPEKNIHIIYISSKTEYAMELFQVHPYDFLIKPITE